MDDMSLKHERAICFTHLEVADEAGTVEDTSSFDENTNALAICAMEERRLGDEGSR